MRRGGATSSSGSRPGGASGTPSTFRTRCVMPLPSINPAAQFGSHPLDHSPSALSPICDSESGSSDAKQSAISTRSAGPPAKCLRCWIKGEAHAPASGNGGIPAGGHAGGGAGVAALCQVPWAEELAVVALGSPGGAPPRVRPRVCLPEFQTRSQEVLADPLDSISCA